jgi:hypothetical protein
MYVRVFVFCQQGHAYGILQMKVLESNGETFRMIQCRNPCGMSEWCVVPLCCIAPCGPSSVIPAGEAIGPTMTSCGVTTLMLRKL